MSENLKFGILEDLYQKNEATIVSKDAKIRLLEEQLVKYQKPAYPIADMQELIRIHYPTIQSLAIGDMINQDKDTVCYAVVDFPKSLRKSDQQKIRQILQLRAHADSLVVVFN